MLLFGRTWSGKIVVYILWSYPEVSIYHSAITPADKLHHSDFERRIPPKPAAAHGSFLSLHLSELCTNNI